MNTLVAPMEPVRLAIDGAAHEGWTEISLARALDRAAGDFTLGLTDKRQGPDGVTVPPRLYCGAHCQVFIGKDLVLTGYVDEVAVSYGASEHTIKVTGRSKTCDLIDCSVDPAFSDSGSGGKQNPIRGLFHKEGEIARMVHGKPSPTAGLSAVTRPAGPAASSAKGGHFRGQRLAQVASLLARPYGIDVKISGDSGEPFAGLTVEKGDKVFDVIERMCRLRGLLASDDAYGHLILARPGSGRFCGTLELGKTILAADGRFSVKERYSEYRVFGQSPGLHRDGFGAVSDEDELLDPNDDEDGDDEPSATGPSVEPKRHADIAERARSVASAQGAARDDSVTRYRLLVVQAETAAEAGGVEARAQWEAAHRLGKSISLTYTVPGWRTADGTLWETNGVVKLIDPLMALERSLVIGGVDFSLDESDGMVARAILGGTRLIAGRQVGQTQRHAEEARDDTEIMQSYGFASRPHAGAEGIVVEAGGDASHQVMIVCDDARYRFGPLKSGEAALYDDQSQHLYLYRHGIVIKDRFGQTIRLSEQGIAIESPKTVALKAPEIKLGDGEMQPVARIGDVVEITRGSSAGRRRDNAALDAGRVGAGDGRRAGWRLRLSELAWPAIVSGYGGERLSQPLGGDLGRDAPPAGGCRGANPGGWSSRIDHTGWNALVEIRQYAAAGRRIGSRLSALVACPLKSDPS